MPTKTMTKKDKSRALKLGVAALKVQKQYAAQQAKARKAAEDLKKAAKKVKVEDGPGNLYKVKVNGKEYLLDENGWSNESEPPQKFMPAVEKAIKDYSHKRICLKPTKSHGYVNGVTFKDSDGRLCMYDQSRLSYYDTCYFGLCSAGGADIHISDFKYEDLSTAIRDVSRGETKSVTLKDRDGARFNIKPDGGGEGGVILTVLTKAEWNGKKKILKRNNVMRFDAKAAETVGDIIDNFTSFERNFETD